MTRHLTIWSALFLALMLSGAAWARTTFPEVQHAWWILAAIAALVLAASLFLRRSSDE